MPEKITTTTTDIEYRDRCFRTLGSPCVDLIKNLIEQPDVRVGKPIAVDLIKVILRIQLLSPEGVRVTKTVVALWTAK